MPIYAYQCTTCGHHFDKLQRLSDPDPEVCPSCGATGNVKRQLTAPSFRLSGSGWYETDFKKDSDKKRNLVETGDGGDKKDKGSSDTAAKSGDAAVAPAKSADSKPADKSSGASSAGASAAPKSEPAAKPASKPASGDA